MKAREGGAPSPARETRVLSGIADAAAHLRSACDWGQVVVTDHDVTTAKPIILSA